MSRDLPLSSQSTATRSRDIDSSARMPAASGSRIKDAANHLCGLIKARGRLGPGELVKKTFSYNWDPSELGAIGIETSLEVKKDCEFVYSDAACDRYVNVPIDSCNCAGINGKQGGGEVENNCYKLRLDPEKQA